MATAQDPGWSLRAALRSRLWLLLVLAGAVLRIRLYLANRSLWLDEAMLSLNLAERSYRALLAPLDHNQGAPVGFLLAQRALIELFGTDERVLRLLPLLAGLAALALFARLARRLLGPAAADLALAAFALSPTLLYYSSEAKQYMVDVLAAVLLLLAATDLREHRGATRRRLVAFGLLGAILPWFSHAAVLVGGGLAVALALSERPLLRRHLPLVLGLGSLALASLLCEYLLFLRPLGANPALREYWADAFVPLAPRLHTLKWWYFHSLALFELSAGFPFRGLALVCFAAGIADRLKRDPQVLALLLAPLGVAVLASAAGGYPLRGQLLLFLVPALLLLVGSGIDWLRGTADRSRAWLGTLAAVLLLAKPAMDAAEGLRQPPGREEMRDLLACLEEAFEPGERVYVYREARHALRFYLRHGKPRPGLQRAEFVEGGEGSNAGPELLRELRRERERGTRWYLYAHPLLSDGGDAERLGAAFLSSSGRLDLVCQAPGGAVQRFTRE